MIVHSWFWVAIGILTLGGAVEFAAKGNTKMMLVSLLYGLADFVLATIGE